VDIKQLVDLNLRQGGTNMTNEELTRELANLQKRVETLEILMEKRETSRVAFSGVKPEHQQWVERRKEDLKKRSEGR
jgi:hypothetical protein